MIRGTSRLILLAVCMPLLLNCSQHGKGPGEPVLPYELRWGTTGGVTGGGEGYILRRDGTLARWKQAVPGAMPEEETSVLKISAKACAEIRALIEKNNLLALDQQGAGNMTTSLLIRQDGKEQRLAWAGMPGDAPKALASIMVRLESLVNQPKK